MRSVATNCSRRGRLPPFPLFQISLKKSLQFLPRDVVSLAAVVEVAVGGVRDNHKLLVRGELAAGNHVVVGGLVHVAAVRFFAMDDEDCRADFV